MMGRLSAQGAHTWSRRQFLAAGALACGALACGRPEEPPPNPPLSKPPNIVVYLPDSLRADVLGCYGGAWAATPYFDAFATQAYLFERCHSQATWTKPSVASLFTGLRPNVHRGGLSIEGHEDTHPGHAQMLRPSFSLLAEELTAAGYETAWFLSNMVIGPEFGFGRGMKTIAAHNGQSPQTQMAHVVEWLESRPTAPFFLFVHALDPHWPYTPSPHLYRKLFGTEPDEEFRALSPEDRDFCMAYLHDRQSLLPNGGVVRFEGRSAAVVEAMHKLYAAEVFTVDQEFGRLVQTLVALELLDETVIIALSDHGESFGEHGLFYHGEAPYRHQTHVPLLMRLPGQTDSRRVPWTVSLFDLYSTCLAFADRTPPAVVQSQPLFTREGRLAVGEDRTVYSLNDFRQNDPAAWHYMALHGDKKIMENKRDGLTEAYDLATDPGETRNLAGGKALPEALDVLRRRFEVQWGTDRALASTFGEPVWNNPEQSTREDIEALGYI